MTETAPAEIDREPAVRAGTSRRATVITAGTVFVIGLVLRLLLLDSPAAILNSDEAYTRIEAFEILQGEFPMILGGTVYTFPVEAYLYAPITYLFGADVVPLKLVSTMSWVVAAGVMYALVRQMAGDRAGLIAGSMLWLTPGALLLISITAYPAYSSGLLVTTVALLLGAMVVDAPHARRSTMVLFGAAAGFGFWLHPMFVSSLLPLVAFVLWSLRRRLDAWISVVVGGILGCLPFLLWNALNGWPSLETPVRVPGTYVDRMRTFAVDLIPRAIGSKDATLEWHHGVMGPLLYLTSIAVAAVGVWSLVRRAGPRSRWLPVVVLAGVFPIMAMFRNLIYANDGRYGIIALPVIVVVLAVGVDHLAGRAPTWRAVAVIGLVAAVWFVGLIRPTVAPFLESRGTDPNAQLGQIVDVLDDAGIDRIYGSYWATLPVDFAGDNRIVSGVFPFWPVRFPERQRVVETTPPDEVAVLFMRSDENPADLLLPADRYHRIEIGDRVVYLPIAAARRAGLAD